MPVYMYMLWTYLVFYSLDVRGLSHILNGDNAVHCGPLTVSNKPQFSTARYVNAVHQILRVRLGP